MWKHLCWSHFLTMLQLSKPETSLKKDSSTGIFLWIFSNFSKNLLYKTSQMTALADSSITTKVLSTYHTLLVFFITFFFIIDNCNHGSLLRKCLKMKAFLLFTIVYSKITLRKKMLLRQFRLSNNLLMHIRENTDFLWQKPPNCQVLKQISKADYTSEFHNKYINIESLLQVYF